MINNQDPELGLRILSKTKKMKNLNLCDAIQDLLTDMDIPYLFSKSPVPWEEEDVFVIPFTFSYMIRILINDRSRETGFDYFVNIEQIYLNVYSELNSKEILSTYQVNEEEFSYPGLIGILKALLSKRKSELIIPEKKVAF